MILKNRIITCTECEKKIREDMLEDLTEKARTVSREKNINIINKIFLKHYDEGLDKNDTFVLVADFYYNRLKKHYYKLVSLLFTAEYAFIISAINKDSLATKIMFWIGLVMLIYSFKYFKSNDKSFFKEALKDGNEYLKEFIHDTNRDLILRKEIIESL